MQLFNVYSRFDLAITKAQGHYLYDADGQAYLDMYGGHGVISIGHGHPHYVARLTEQLEQLGFYSNSVEMPGQAALSKQLSNLSGYPEHALFLCNSGAEANENALKLASFHTGKRKVLAFRKSFHGRTSACLNVTDNPGLSAPINQNGFPVEWLDLNDTARLEQAFRAQDVCAVIVEGIQGVGGLDMPSPSYWKALETICKQQGALLIVDEVQSGFGRSGKFFAHQLGGIQADIVTMAKGMGNGFPVAGLLIHPEIQARYGMLGTTFGGNPLACAAVASVLDVLDWQNLLQHAAELGKSVQATLAEIPGVQQVKGAGLMLGLEFEFPVKELRSRLLFEEHIFTGSSSNPNLLRVLPPLTISWTEFTSFITSLKQLLP